MYLLYVDSSGAPELTDVNSCHYVLLGLSVPERTWFALESRLSGLKRGFCQPGQTFELHAKDFACSIKEQEEITGFSTMSYTDRRAHILALRDAKIKAEPTAEARRKRVDNYKRTHPFIHLTRGERSRLLEDALDLVGSHASIRLFGEAISKAHPGIANASVNPVHQAFEQVVARFDASLQRLDAAKLQRSPRRARDNGLLVLDHDYSTEATLSRLFQDYRAGGHQWGELRHVIDVPFFASSDRVSGLQLVDIFAYAVRRYLDTGAVVGSFEEKNFQRIYHRFDRGQGGKLHGLRHFILPGSCKCLICQERGHAPAPPPASPPTF